MTYDAEGRTEARSRGATKENAFDKLLSEFSQHAFAHVMKAESYSEENRCLCARRGGRIVWQ